VVYVSVPAQGAVLILTKSHQSCMLCVCAVESTKRCSYLTNCVANCFVACSVVCGLRDALQMLEDTVF
jgi:hypothetical protein